ncbi:LysM peptidoglycan-binding domain-containing protein [Pseudomonas juntendi]|uniref:LysM peptidoglycan-binding domain-containing protein n=1 Tax=Pseudomonas TaxID=286 RepID=UPI0012AE0C47|nr:MULTISPECIES: LysM domain-containing protein [Pseudomonas]MDG9918212.1 LysM peptidoglycan-binding domain-containing protein [Pseudomonas juntendi]MDH0507660.1 LysM peptidoglycan-binding domain-containing protein [Pseudomonas juntendi]MDH1044858.1 LysM peptidoglycan-binding domain-containing protein [Pseudomonas juntendi]MRT62329.1 LysM peptidoglycan-binding domain-containing protein [Pseudomonas sp. CAH-1]
MTSKTQIQQATDFYINLMVLQRAEANNEIDPFFREMGKKLGATHAFKPPYATVSASFTPEGVAASKVSHADFWEQIHAEAKTGELKDKLVNEAGYSAEQVAQIPAEVIQHFAVVDEFEKRFPSEESKKYPLIDRLRDGKDQLFDALGSEAGRKTLAAVSLGISFASGGIVTRLGIKAGAALASKVVQNEAVQEFAGKLQDRAGAYLEKMGVPTATIASRFDGMKQSLKGVIESPAFQRYGKPSLALAGIALGAVMIGSVDHDKLMDLANSGFARGADLAGQGIELGSQVIDKASAIAGDIDWEMTAANAVNGIGSGISAIGENAVEFVQNPVGYTLQTVGDAAIGVRDALEGSGEMLANIWQEAGNLHEEAHQQMLASLSGLDNVTGGISPDGQHEIYASAVDDQVTAAPGVEPVAEAPAVPAEAAVPAQSSDAYRIEKGDSLWSIAREQFEAHGVTPTNGQIQEATKALYEANRDAIGSNPDLILAGRNITVDPAIFGAHAEVEAAPAVPAVPLHEQVKNLGGGLPANDSAEGFKSAIARVTSRMREVSESTPGL